MRPTNMRSFDPVLLRRKELGLQRLHKIRPGKDMLTMLIPVKLTVPSDLTEDFCNILEQYQSSLLGSQPKARINLRASHSWDEVVRAAKDAEAAYLAEVKRGAPGVVRGFFRNIGDCSASVTPWIGLLPNDKYFSTLCGGLKLILGARTMCHQSSSSLQYY